jgi:hypothetical protein
MTFGRNASTARLLIWSIVGLTIGFAAYEVFYVWCPAYLQAEQLALQFHPPLPVKPHGHELCWTQFGIRAGILLLLGGLAEIGPIRITRRRENALVRGA